MFKKKEHFMSKKMKIFFENSGAGTQVDGTYFSNEVLEKVKKMSRSDDFDESDINQYIHDNSSGDYILCGGIWIHDEELKFTIMDGDKEVKIPVLLLEEGSGSLQEQAEAEGLGNNKQILAISEDDIMHEELRNFKSPTKEQHVLLEIVRYKYGQLHGEFKVEDDVKIEDLDMNDFKLTALSVDGGYGDDITRITYEQGTIGFPHEVEIKELFYKGEEIELNLNFQGGMGDQQLWVRDEDGDLSLIAFGFFEED
jgi:hypothetical protein